MSAKREAALADVPTKMRQAYVAIRDAKPELNLPTNIHTRQVRKWQKGRGIAWKEGRLLLS